MADEPAKIITDGHGAPVPFTHCENCGTELQGHWCYKCSQPAIDYHRSFGHVIYEVLAEFWDWDSKIFGTIGLLIVKPWRLTIDFVGGRRVRHAHPLRLYLIAGFIFFFVVNYGAKGLKIEPGKTKFDSKDRAELQAELDKGDLPPIAREQLQRLLDQSASSPAPSVAPSATASATPSPTGSPSETEKRTYGQINERPFLVFDDAKSTTPFERWLEARAKEKMGEHGTKMGLFIATLFSNLPYMMLCCIPLFAFVLKVLYVRQRIFYIDHLIYALHIHTFFYTGVMLIAFATMGLNHVVPGAFANWIIAAFWITFVMQIFLSIRYVYRQGWFFSTLKFLTGGIIYLFVLTLAFAATFFITLAIP